MRWWALGFDSWRLALEAGEVVVRRGMLFAEGGGAAFREAGLMVSEKMIAAAELQAAMLGGKLGKSSRVISHAVVRNYRDRVGRNAARLR